MGKNADAVSYTLGVCEAWNAKRVGRTNRQSSGRPCARVEQPSITDFHLPLGGMPQEINTASQRSHSPRPQASDESNVGRSHVRRSFLPERGSIGSKVHHVRQNCSPERGSIGS